jgi:hypothetical protein
VPSIADFAAVLILALSVASICWAVVRITSRAEKLADRAPTKICGYAARVIARRQRCRERRSVRGSGQAAIFFGGRNLGAFRCLSVIV